MQTLVIEQPAPYVVRAGALTVCLVGCGGTGSHIAQALGRIAVHIKARREELRLIFVDGDTVEEKNVGRQLFTQADVGKNKAQVLAARFSALFGLAIDAVPEMATVDVLAALGGIKKKYGGKNESTGILVGAVDNAVARKSLHGALRAQSCWNIWLDCGNHDYSGQVAVGTETWPDRLKDAVKFGLCTRLPAPSLTNPNILEATPRALRDNCADAVEANLQGLMVNTQVAAIAAVYLDRLVIHRRITQFETVFSQEPMSMRSTPITASAITAVAAAYKRHCEAKQEPTLLEKELAA